MPGMTTSVKKTTFSKGHYTTGVGKGSKTRDPKCSDAMSKWKKGGGGTMAKDIAATLGKCRARAHALKTGHMYREAGQEAKAQVHESRAARGAKGGVVGIGARKTMAQELRAKRSSQGAESKAFADRVHGAVAKVGPEGQHASGVLASHVHKQYQKLHGKIDIKDFKERLRTAHAHGHLSFKAMPETHEHAPGYVTKKGAPTGERAAAPVVASKVTSGPSLKEQAADKREEKGSRSDRLARLTEKAKKILSSKGVGEDGERHNTSFGRHKSLKDAFYGKPSTSKVTSKTKPVDQKEVDKISGRVGKTVDKLTSATKKLEEATAKRKELESRQPTKPPAKGGFKVLHEHIKREQDAGRLPKGNNVHASIEKEVNAHAANLASTRGHKPSGRDYQEAIDHHIGKLKESSSVGAKSESAVPVKKKSLLERMEENARNARAESGMSPKEQAAFHRSSKGTHKERLEYVKERLKMRRPQTVAEHASKAVDDRSARESLRDQAARKRESKGTHEERLNRLISKSKSIKEKEESGQRQLEFQASQGKYIDPKMYGGGRSGKWEAERRKNDADNASVKLESSKHVSSFHGKRIEKLESKRGHHPAESSPEKVAFRSAKKLEETKAAIAQANKNAPGAARAANERHAKFMDAQEARGGVAPTQARAPSAREAMAEYIKNRVVNPNTAEGRMAANKAKREQEAAQASTGGTGESKQFAEHIKEAASRVSGHGRFGQGKAFISHVHQEYTKAHGSIPLANFKSKLMEAHTSGHVTLSRANMIEGMNPRSVGMSKTIHPMGHGGTGEFHFIESPGGGAIPPKRNMPVGGQLKRIKEKAKDNTKRTHRTQQAQEVAQAILGRQPGPFSKIRAKRLRGK